MKIKKETIYKVVSPSSKDPYQTYWLKFSDKTDRTMIVQMKSHNESPQYLSHPGKGRVFEMIDYLTITEMEEIVKTKPTLDELLKKYSLVRMMGDDELIERPFNVVNDDWFVENGFTQKV